MHTRGIHTNANALHFSLETRWLFAFIITALVVFGLMTPPFDDIFVLKRFFFDENCTAANALDCWRISRANDEATFYLHTLPNRLFVKLCIAALAIAISSHWYPNLRAYRLPLLVLVTSLALCPAIVALLKQFAHHYCPSQLAEFRGEPMPNAKAHCYPAAHPAAGFSLLALAISPVAKPWRIAGGALGITLGSALAWIQMARGEHAPSHILATLAIVLFVSYSIRCVIISRRLSQS